MRAKYYSSTFVGGADVVVKILADSTCTGMAAVLKPSMPIYLAVRHFGKVSGEYFRHRTLGLQPLHFCGYRMRASFDIYIWPIIEGQVLQQAAELSLAACQPEPGMDGTPQQWHSRFARVTFPPILLRLVRLDWRKCASPALLLSSLYASAVA